MLQKSTFSRLRRAEGCAYYFENLRIWNSKGALINISKISRNAEERLLRGGVYYQLPGSVIQCYFLLYPTWKVFILKMFAALRATNCFVFKKINVFCSLAHHRLNFLAFGLMRSEICFLTLFEKSGWALFSDFAQPEIFWFFSWT